MNALHWSPMVSFFIGLQYSGVYVALTRQVSLSILPSISALVQLPPSYVPDPAANSSSTQPGKKSILVRRCFLSSTEPALPTYPIILCALFCQSCTMFLPACVPDPGSGLKLISYNRVSIADKRWQKRLSSWLSLQTAVC